MNTLLIIILFVGISLFIYNMNKPDIKNTISILDDINPIVMDQVNNGKLNVWTFCQDEDYNFKMSWRYPLLSYNYKYPFQKLCIHTLLKNMDKYDVNIIIVTRKNAHLYVPNFPSRLKDSGYQEKKVIDLLGAYLLEKYGGLWLSPYTSVLNRDYRELFNDCRNYEMVTFGTSPNITNSEPFNGEFTAVNNKIIGSRRGSICITSYKKLLEQFIFSKQYEYLYNHVGRDPEPLGEAIHYTKPNIKHYCSKSDGSYNNNNRKIHINEFLGKTPIQFKDPSNLYFISFPYEELETDTNYRWILNTPNNELMNSNISLIEFIKKQL